MGALIFRTQISIPFTLAEALVSQRKLVNVYETNQLIKALDTWLVLKHLNVRFPHIVDWNTQKKQLLQICKVSETIFRHRLKILSNLKLLTYGKNITLCSWYDLGKRFDINVDRKFSIQYTTEDNKRIQDWIIAVEIKSNQSRQRIAIARKIGSPEIKKAVENYIIERGAEKDKIRDLEYLLSWLKMEYFNDFVKASPLHDLLVAIRPDDNRSVKGIKKSWNCRNICTISYWKKILQKSGIIDVSKLQIRSIERVRNKNCKVLWLDDIKQTLLCVCDQITVLLPWKRSNFFCLPQ